MSSVESRAVRKMIGTPRALRAEPAGDLEALDVGQHHVEHHQVRLEAGHGGDRLVTGRCRLDLEALEAQRHRDHLDDARLVVDDQHPAARGRGLGAGRILLACHQAAPS